MLMLNKQKNQPIDDLKQRHKNENKIYIDVASSPKIINGTIIV